MMDTDSAAVVGFIFGIIAVLFIIYVAAPVVGIAVDEMNKYHASDDYLQGYNIGLTSCHDYLKSDTYSTRYAGWNYWLFHGDDIQIIPAEQKTGYDAGISQCDKVKTLERDLFMACRLRQPQAADLVVNEVGTTRPYDWAYTCRGTIYHGDDDKWNWTFFEPVTDNSTEFNSTHFPNITFSQLRSEAL